MLHDIIGILPPFMIRPANVPEGAHIQWEIELLGFEMPKVFTNSLVKFKLFTALAVYLQVAIIRPSMLYGSECWAVKC